jgi:peroxiredoxin
MALTPSNMLDLGVTAPNFKLTNGLSDNLIGLDDVRGAQGTLVMFICVHCPYVIHVQEEIARIAREYKKRGVGFVAISSNDIEKYPQDAPEHMKAQSEQLQFDFPYLFDESQEVARAYDAACTPDFYLFDNQDVLVYRGRLDESRPNNDKPLTGGDLRDAIDRLLAGKPQGEKQYPSMGCNIKWKS